MEFFKYLMHTDEDNLENAHDNSITYSDDTSKIRGVSVLSMTNAQQYFERQEATPGTKNYTYLNNSNEAYIFINYNFI